MIRALWRLPLAVLVFVATVPSIRSEPAQRSSVPVFAAARNTAHFEPNVPVLPLLRRGADPGGSLRLIAVAVAAKLETSATPELGVAIALRSTHATRASFRGLGRAPPATL